MKHGSICCPAGCTATIPVFFSNNKKPERHQRRTEQFPKYRRGISFFVFFILKNCVILIENRTNLLKIAPTWWNFYQFGEITHRFGGTTHQFGGKSYHFGGTTYHFGGTTHQFGGLTHQNAGKSYRFGATAYRRGGAIFRCEAIFQPGFAPRVIN